MTRTTNKEVTVDNEQHKYSLLTEENTKSTGRISFGRKWFSPFHC